jgi:type I restriction enzyme, S subunit
MSNPQAEKMNRPDEIVGRHFKPYPKYKDSGVEWLGEVPEGWEVKTIRSLAIPGYKTFVDGDWIESPFIRDDGIRLIQTGNIGIGYFKEQGYRYIDEETFNSFGCTEVKPGDVLICRLAEPVGRACLAPDIGGKMITSVDVCILKAAHDVDSKFIVYLLSSSEYLSWLSGICRGGTRDRVSRSMLGAIKIQKPPLDEQKLIAFFLDRETTKIDALVAKKERLIDLLQEKRTALITRAVTKGLYGVRSTVSAQVKYIDSGVDWLGEVPEGWEVKRLKYPAKLNTGGTPAGVVDEAFEEDGVPWVKPDNLRGDLGIDNSYRCLSKNSAKMIGIIKAGSVLVCGIGTVGKVGFTVFDVCTNQQINAITFTKEIHNLFGSYVVTCLGQEFLKRANKVTIPICNKSAMGEPSIVVPPYKDQQEIVIYIKHETAKIDALTEKVREAIEKLKEYRTALISAAVTGKIDLRKS